MTLIWPPTGSPSRVLVSGVPVGRGASSTGATITVTVPTRLAPEASVTW